MSRVLLCCLYLCAWGLAASAQRSDDPERLWLTVTIEPDFVLGKGAYVGGEIVMHVRLVSSDPFKRLRLDLPEIEGVRMETLVPPYTLQVNVFGGKGYRHETRLAIVPEQSGTIVIPPITVTGILEPQGGTSLDFKETHPQQSITVHPASPEFGGDVWIVSRQATMEDSWSPEIALIQTGDTVRRRVALSVAGVTAADLPELTLKSNDGYRVLSTDVSSETERTDTGFIAHLQQSWEIYVETDDVTHIDAVRFPYWNPESATTEIAGVPRQRIEPLPRDALELRERMRERVLAEHRAKRLGLVALLSLPAAALIAFLALAVWRALPTRADLRFWRACRQTDAPLEFYRSFLSWSRQTFGSRTVLGQEHFSALGVRATEQVERLHRSVFGPRGGAFEAKRMAASVIWASRRMTIKRFMSAIVPGMSRFLFLR